MKIAKQNYTLVYQGIGIFRDEMLPFVRTHLEQFFGADAWELGVRKHFPKEEFDALEKNFQERFKGGAGPTRPATDKWEILGVNNFFNIIDGNWKKVFAASFNNDRTCLLMLQEITRFRNPVMHTETGDLQDDDAWRALDTMYRLLATIESTAQTDLQELKTQLRRAWAAVAHQPVGIDPSEHGISSSGALSRLEHAIIERAGKKSEVHLNFLRYKRDLASALSSEEKGTNDQNTDAKKTRALRELDTLSLTYLDIGFDDASLLPLPGRALTPEQAARKVRSLDDKVAALTKELTAAKINRIIQHKTGADIPALDRKIQAKETELATKQAELEQLREQFTPPSHFTVKRAIEPVMPFYFVEQPITVRVEITNAGTHPAKITYKEGLPDSFVTPDKLNFTARIEPGHSQTFTYACFATSAGEHNLVTSFLRYQSKTEGWDRFQDTPISVQPGTDPRLEAKREYRHTPNGIEVLVRLENKGTRTARNVHFSEHLTLAGSSKPYPLRFHSDLLGGASHVVDCQLPTHDPNEIQCPSDSVITFENTAGAHFDLPLTSAISHIEYNFDQTPQLVGRQTELDTFSQIQDRVWQSGLDPSAVTTKHLILVEGTEGTGKTRLIKKFAELATFTGFRVFTEDCKNQSPVKRMLRQLLGFAPDTNDNEGLFARLNELLPGELDSLAREHLFRFVSPAPITFDKDELNQLKSAVLLFLNRVCPRSTLLIFENAQLTPVGSETDLLLEILYSLLVNHSTPILICVTYRPGETGMPHYLANLKMSSDYFERICLDPLKQADTEALLRQLIPFPELSQQLRGYIFDVSDGNPFYLIELLRLLTSPNVNYLKRVGGEWFPAQDYAKFRQRIPTQIETLILDRAKLETGQDLPFLRTLSVIGFEIPLPLVEKVMAQRHSELTLDDILRRLNSLKKSGFLVEVENGYEFEHQLKREVIYKDPDFPDPQRRAIRDSVAKVLMSDQNLYNDPEEHIRQLARHLAKGTRALRAEHTQDVIRAASLESDRRNFPRSLEYFTSVLDILPTHPENIDPSQDSSFDKFFDRARTLIGRSQVYQFQASWLSANRDLEAAYALVAPLSVLDKQDPATARALRVQIDKERGRVLIRQNRLNDANKMLYRARIGLEGNLRLRRFFPPKSIQFHRALVEIYLDLADIFLRKQDFGPCRSACRRAEGIAKKASRNLHDHTLLPLVYLSLGRLHQRQGEHEQSLRWLQSGLRSAQAQKHPDEFLEGRLLGEIANCYRTLDDPDAAVENYERAIEIQDKLGDNLGLAQNLGGLGDLYFDTGNAERAEYFSKQAHSLQRQVNDQESFWRTSFTLALLHAQQNSFAEAAHYWADARVVLIDRGFIESLKSIKKQKQIYSFLKSLADYYRDNNLWEERVPFEEDLSVISPAIEHNRDELARGQMELANTYFKTYRWQKALDAYAEALSTVESPALRAEILEALGDTHAAYEPPKHILSVEAAQADEFQDKAEQHYLQATQAFALLEDSTRAIAVFKKLVERIIVDEAGLLQFSFTFHRLFEIVPINLPLGDQFVDKSVELLVSKNLPAAAGDILVYAARLAAAHANTTIPFEKKLDYLHRAEFMYRKGTTEDLIWGFNMMIPTYYRLGLWEDVATCFEQLFELNLAIQDASEFLEAFRAVSVLHERLKPEEYKRIVLSAVTKYQDLPFSNDQASDFLHHAGKAFSHFAFVEKDPQIKEDDYAQAINYLNQALEITPEKASSSILNDLALIYNNREDNVTALDYLNQAIMLSELSGSSEGAARERINRAGIYLEMGNLQSAKADYEEGIAKLEQVVARWDERVKYVDKRPLSPSEVRVLHYDKQWLATSYSQYARFLLRSNPSRAKYFAEKSDRIFSELGDESGHKEAAVLEILSALSERGSTAIPDLLGENFTIMRACPKCSHVLKFDATHCDSCGQEICSGCGAALQPDATVCPRCGKEFDLLCPRCNAALKESDDVCPNCGLDVSNRCPSCKGEIDTTRNICRACGQPVCPVCGAAVDNNDEQCKSCGADLDLYCPECNQKVTAADTVCPNCGVSLEA